MNKKLLFVDDDSDDTELFCEALTEIDQTIYCYCATDGQRAINKLQEHSDELPDLIFMDINMPGMNGWECLSLLKSSALFCEIPVIIYSTSSHSRDIDKAHDLGALCFFNKPNNYRALQDKLKIILKALEDNDLRQISFDAPNQILFY